MPSRPFLLLHRGKVEGRRFTEESTVVGFSLCITISQIKSLPNGRRANALKKMMTCLYENTLLWPQKHRILRMDTENFSFPL
jgi:hypothetical protein